MKNTKNYSEFLKEKAGSTLGFNAEQPDFRHQSKDAKRSKYDKTDLGNCTICGKSLSQHCQDQGGLFEACPVGDDSWSRINFYNYKGRKPGRDF